MTVEQEGWRTEKLVLPVASDHVRDLKKIPSLRWAGAGQSNGLVVRWENLTGPCLDSGDVPHQTRAGAGEYLGEDFDRMNHNLVDVGVVEVVEVVADHNLLVVHSQLVGAVEEPVGTGVGELVVEREVGKEGSLMFERVVERGHPGGLL